MSVGSKDIDNALFALDSYYANRINRLPVIAVKDVGAFYATAYRNSAGGIAIAFRGTDGVSDAVTGYDTGLGYATSVQAELAAKFVRDVRAANSHAKPPPIE